ncbi:MAG: N-acetyltransferase [Bacteroidales bacterium]|nr:N-acetyltransferase [Bacteroidales bacterium]
MEGNLTVRQARKADLPEIMAVLEAAKGIMRASGNAGQWINGYPSEEVVLEDIAGGCGYVVLADGRLSAYFAFIPSPEPTYAEIFDGAWLDDTLPYHVVHRIGSYPEVHGIFRAVLDWCFERDPNIRIDTHEDNRIMQHCILRYGFRYCGIIYLESGDPRLAYQLIR